MIKTNKYTTAKKPYHKLIEAKKSLGKVIKLKITRSKIIFKKFTKKNGLAFARMALVYLNLSSVARDSLAESRSSS